MTKGLHKNSLRKGDNPHQWMIDDARMELIQQIKAEIERLKTDSITEESVSQDDNYYEGKISVCEELLTKLDTLQKQPVCEKKTDIVEDLKHYLATTSEEQIKKDWDELKEWGKVGPSVAEFLGWNQPVCEELEEELERFLIEDVDVIVNEDTEKVRIFDVDTGKEDIDITYSDLKNIARHFAQWQKEKDNEVADKALTTTIKLQQGWYEKGIAQGEKNMKEQMMKQLRSYCFEEIKRFPESNDASRATRETYYDIIGYLDKNYGCK
jgi:hypothetical protein